MKKVFLIMSAAIMFMMNVSFAQSLEEVLKKHFETIGQDKLSQVQSMIIKGKISQMGMEIPMTIINKRPNKVRTEMTIQGMTMISAFDGKTGWTINPMMGAAEPQVLPEDQAERTKDQADMDGMLFNWKEKGYKAELMPQEEIEGSKVNVIKLSKQNGDVTTYYIDSENNVILKLLTKVSVEGNESTVETMLSNYKPLEGMLYPYTMETKVNGQTMMQFTTDSVEINKDTPDTLFAMPEKK